MEGHYAATSSLRFLHIARLIPFVKSKSICSVDTPICTEEELAFYENEGKKADYCMPRVDHAVERVSGKHASRMRRSGGQGRQ
jgi:hypothetical protein